ncbi:MAG: hypothetical protein POH28_14850 [Acidocella sp.]|nr:hypothetical protein [Acidocella sp.]
MTPPHDWMDIKPLIPRAALQPAHNTVCLMIPRGNLNFDRYPWRFQTFSKRMKPFTFKLVSKKSGNYPHQYCGRCVLSPITQRDLSFLQSTRGKVLFCNPYAINILLWSFHRRCGVYLKNRTIKQGIGRFLVFLTLAAALSGCVPYIVMNSMDHQHYSDYVIATQKLNTTREENHLQPEPIMTFRQWDGTDPTTP